VVSPRFFSVFYLVFLRIVLQPFFPFLHHPSTTPLPLIEHVVYVVLVVVFQGRKIRNLDSSDYATLRYAHPPASLRASFARVISPLTCSQARSFVGSILPPAPYTGTLMVRKGSYPFLTDPTPEILECLAIGVAAVLAHVATMMPTEWPCYRHNRDHFRARCPVRTHRSAWSSTT